MEKIIIDEDQFMRTISRISHEIIEKHQDLSELVIAGIQRRGVEIADLIKRKINELSDANVPSIDLDITFYRDDLEYAEPQNASPSHFISVQGKTVILVDDVLYTGRTVRAALDALVDYGRAARVELVIFVDRGHRELPIRADYVGKNVPTSRSEKVQVRTMKFDSCYEVALQTQ